MTTEEKENFSQGVFIPKVGHESAEALSSESKGFVYRRLDKPVRLNPDGSKVKLGESSSFKFYGNNKEIVHGCVNMKAEEIVDVLMNDFLHYKTKPMAESGFN